MYKDELKKQLKILAYKKTDKYECFRGNLLQQRNSPSYLRA